MRDLDSVSKTWRNSRGNLSQPPLHSHLHVIHNYYLSICKMLFFLLCSSSWRYFQEHRDDLPVPGLPVSVTGPPSGSPWGVQARSTWVLSSLIWGLGHLRKGIWNKTEKLRRKKSNGDNHFNINFVEARRVSEQIRGLCDLVYTIG